MVGGGRKLWEPLTVKQEEHDSLCHNGQVRASAVALTQLSLGKQEGGLPAVVQSGRQTGTVTTWAYSSNAFHAHT